MISMTTLIHSMTSYQRNKQQKQNEKEETVELLEKKETPQEEYSRLLEEIKKRSI